PLTLGPPGGPAPTDRRRRAADTDPARRRHSTPAPRPPRDAAHRTGPAGQPLVEGPAGPGTVG
ncbi:hypothetical protein ACWGVR_30290, partial [Streptomyces xanthophaeus]